VLAPTLLSAAEAAAVGARHDFITYWTRKEAVVKATGDGLAVPLREVLVSAPDAAPRLLAYPARTLTAVLRDLAPRPGYAAALAVLAAEPVAVRERDAAPLLAGPPSAILDI